MVCDVLPLYNGYILAADQLPVFVHTERLSKTKIKLVFLYVLKQTTDTGP